MSPPTTISITYHHIKIQHSTFVLLTIHVQLQSMNKNEITFVQLCGHSFKILNKFQSYPTKSKERHHLDDFSFALLSIGKLNATDMLSWCLELFAYWGWTCYEHIWSQVISTDNVYYHWSVHTAGIVWKPIGFW